MRLALILMLLPLSAQAQALISTHVLRAGSLITAADVTLVDADIPGAVDAVEAALGLAVKTTIYAGRPITPESIGPAAIIQRNQTVSLVYHAGPLAIVTEGRALAAGGIGDAIKVMNTTSHAVVLGQIGTDGAVSVGP